MTMRSAEEFAADIRRDIEAAYACPDVSVREYFDTVLPRRIEDDRRAHNEESARIIAGLTAKVADARQEAEVLSETLSRQREEIHRLADLLADSEDLRVRETPAVARLNEISEMPTGAAEGQIRRRAEAILTQLQDEADAENEKPRSGGLRKE